MNDIEFINTKNKIEILILKIEKKYEGKEVPERMNELLRTLYNALSLILKQDNYIEILKKQIIDIKLQNIHAYKQTAQLKKKIKWG
tara:strand:- start:692 stop:949 length:258 start_codon:yes stop_codon:yes gene_type:complete